MIVLFFADAKILMTIYNATSESHLILQQVKVIVFFNSDPFLASINFGQ